MAKKIFKGYTPEEIEMIELGAYVIIVGSDFFDVDGQAAFDKRGAGRHYKNIVKTLVQQMKQGNAKEKLHAERVLRGLRIENLKIH